MTGELFTGYVAADAARTRHADRPGRLGLPLLALDAYEAWRDDLLAVTRLPLVPRYAIYGALFYLVLLFGQYRRRPVHLFPVLETRKEVGERAGKKGEKEKRRKEKGERRKEKR